MNARMRRVARLVVAICETICRPHIVVYALLPATHCSNHEQTTTTECKNGSMQLEGCCTEATAATATTQPSQYRQWFVHRTEIVNCVWRPLAVNSVFICVPHYLFSCSYFELLHWVSGRRLSCWPDEPRCSVKTSTVDRSSLTHMLWRLAFCQKTVCSVMFTGRTTWYKSSRDFRDFCGWFLVISDRFLFIPH